ncbi:Os05g0297000 [Oryza sativa Japonica Group]|uniref:Os05g0297000 protein n=1 Tax=Oryza sativa subsp. japonica TaxID=39947 RepID=Q0DJE0_ORYSJ|nr:Os05g0297000 [Oryza sativa Japonica Group]|eukprot:NP_001055119.1 Os05g0297000 [Oryza sativa Japonica Group]
MYIRPLHRWETNDADGCQPASEHVDSNDSNAYLNPATS